MQPKHTQAVHYLKQGLFDKLITFGQPEDRISELETPRERGVAFEVFAEAYFAIYEICQC